MRKSADDVKQSQDPGLATYPTCRVSIDGSWQNRGHASHNGVVTCISKGKCIDQQTLMKYCRQCKSWEKKKKDPYYQQWFDSHQQKCKINHTGSSGSMESAGAVDMFCRLVDKNELIYSEYLGDGHSSSFKDVFLAKPYSNYGIEPRKLEAARYTTTK